MTAFTTSTLQYPQGQDKPIRRVMAQRAPLTTDNKNFIPGDEWLDRSSLDWWKLVEVTQGDALWVKIGNNAGTLEGLVGDTGGPVLPDASNYINVLGGDTVTVVGNPGTNTLTIDASAGGYPITPYVVGPSGQAGYQTIQSALNAANAAGGGIVYVQPGVYTENLTLYSNTEVVGVPGNSDTGTTGNTVVISGIHTPPTTNSFTFTNVRLESATHIFSSNAAGSAALILENSFIAITNGFLFNLPNWTGVLVTYNMGEGSTNNGIVNNTGGATCFFISATMGAGSGQTMTTSGTVILEEVDFDCPWNAQTGSSISCTAVKFTKPVTLSNNSTGFLSFCQFITGSSAALTMSSSGSIQLNNVVINSSNNPAIAGAGAGSLSLDTVTFVNNSNVAGTLNISTSGGLFPPGNLGSAGDVWTSNGPGSVPTFQANSATDLHAPKFIVGNGSGSAGENYTTIASAIAAASSGDTIYIQQGTYTENLTLKNGVNFCSFDCEGSPGNHNVTIIGKIIDNGVSVNSSFSGLSFQTNGDYNFVVTGGGRISLIECGLIYSNNDSLSIVSGTMEMFECTITATATFKFFDIQASGNLFLWSVYGGDPTAANNCAGGLAAHFCKLFLQMTSSGTGDLVFQMCHLDASQGNVAVLTTSGTGSATFQKCTLLSGSASTLSIGTGTTVSFYDSLATSSNTNVITGLGTLLFNNISFAGTSNGINTSTVTSRSVRPGKLVDSTGSTGTTGQVATAVTGSEWQWQSPSSLPSWVDVTGTTQTLADDTGYLSNNAGTVTFTLPASGTIGDSFRIAGVQGAWTIAQNANQQILIGNAATTVGVGGSLSSTNSGDCIECVATNTSASTVWRVISMIGNITRV